MILSITDLEKTKEFTAIFRHLSTISEQINLYFQKEKLYIQAMDNTHTCMCEIVLHYSWFSDYIVEQTDSCAGIHTKIFYKMLNTHQDNQDIQIECNAGDNHMKIDFTSENPEEFDKSFEMILLDLHNDVLQIPDIEYESDIIMKSKPFSETIDLLSIFHDMVTFTCSEETITLEASGMEGTATIHIPVDDLSEYAILEDKILNISFSLSHLHTMCSFHKLHKEVTLGISEDSPLKMIYPLGEKSYIYLYLAPKVPED